MAIRATVDFSPIALEPGDLRALSAINPDYTKLTASAYHAAPAVTDTFANYYSLNWIARETTLLSDVHALVITKHIHDTIGVHEQLSFANQKTTETLLFDDRIQRVIHKGFTTNLSALDLVSTHYKGAGESDGTGVTDAVSTRLNKLVRDGINLTDAVVLGRLWVEQYDNPAFLDEVVSFALAKDTPDGLSIAELVTILLERSLSEGAGVTDLVSTHINKYVADWISLTDSSTTALNSVNSSTFNFLESLKRDLHKQQLDPVSIIETLSKHSDKQTSDSTNVQDRTNKHLHRSIAEYIFLSDYAQADVILGVLPVSNAITFGDTHTKGVSKHPSEALVIADAILRSSVSGADGFLQVIEVLNKALSKSVTSPTAVADSIARTPTKVLSDTFGINADQITREFTKHIVEGIRLLDAQDIIEKDISIVTLGVVVSEMVSTAIAKTQLSDAAITDEALLRSSKLFGDAASITEHVKRDLVKNLTDATLFTELLTRAFTKRAEDTATLVSTTQLVVGKIITEQNTVSITEQVVIEVGSSLFNSTPFNSSTLG